MRNYYLLCIAMLMLASVGCKKATSDTLRGVPTANYAYPVPQSPGTRPEAGTLVLNGLVVDEDSVPIPNVDVYYYGTHAITNGRGEYAIPGLNRKKERIVVQFRKAGYFPMDAGFTPDSAGYHRLHVALSKKVFARTIDGSRADSFSVGPVHVETPANGFFLNGQPYSGKVNIFGSYLDPRDRRFFERMPGRDMLAKDENGNMGYLISSGAFLLEALTPDGRKLTSEDGSGKNNTATFSYCGFSSVQPPAGTIAWGVTYYGVWFPVSNVTSTPSPYNPGRWNVCFATTQFLGGCNLDYITFGGTPPAPTPPQPTYLSINYCDQNDPINSQVTFALIALYQNGSVAYEYDNFTKVSNSNIGLFYGLTVAQLTGLQSIGINKSINSGSPTPFFTYNGPFPAPGSGLTIPYTYDTCP
jgi:hypothetical protein